ncbi:hypothetical protein MUY27_19395 [Mucilaginibacter sp. RS28]|uniref:DUF3316 domain-containing protein n=1 Tax=Mucilaginibacter straminoryzae TaxID=2932774 RepID=A0A9X2BDB2_9SPHI|nr:hypothetical protein [Mucilaginibacter straminoryzae]MCJ8211892.1 hypothetical protein [Mucilaginibacter straminoryzae]
MPTKNINPIVVKILAIVFVSCTFLGQQAHAGAWPVRPGKVLVSLTGSYFKASRLWDRKGKSSAYADSGSFNSKGLYLYSEIGASRVFTVIVSVPYVSNTYSDTRGKSTQSSFGDAEVGGRVYLANINFKFYFAIQGTVIVPLYSDSPTQNVGYQSLGTDLRLVGSGSGSLGGDKSCYYTIEIGGRQYATGNGPFQLRSTVSYGINLDKKDQLAFSGSGVLSQSSDKAFRGNLSQNKDFSYVQASISAGRSFTKNFSVFLAYNQFVVGRNTGIGSNVSLSLINKF